MTLFFSCASLDAVLREYRRGRAAKTRSCAEYHKMAGISSRFTFIATHRSASSVSLRRPFVVRKIFLFVSFGFVFLRAQPSRSDPSRKSVSLNIPLRGKRRARCFVQPNKDQMSIRRWDKFTLWINSVKICTISESKIDREISKSCNLIVIECIWAITDKKISTHDTKIRNYKSHVSARCSIVKANREKKKSKALIARAFSRRNKKKVNVAWSYPRIAKT